MTLWKLYYHLVWATKERLPLITSDIESKLYQHVQSKTQSLNCSLHAIGGMPDHIHIIVSIRPSLSISDYVKYIKGSSSRIINLNYQNQAFAWQREYGVFSLGGKQLQGAIAYVQNQKIHHHSNQLIYALESTFFNQP